MENFPGNSHTSRMVKNDQENSEDISEPKKAKSVVTGKVIERKKPLGTRVKDLFVNDGGSFAEYLVEKVVVPMMKDMVLSVITQTADGFRQGLEEKLFGPNDQRPRGRTVGYNGGRAPVNYTRYSSGSPMGRRDPNTRPPGPYSARRSNVVKEFIVESREDADAILEELDAVIDTVGHCTVGDFYSTMNEAPETTDESWGWTNLAGARVSKLGMHEFLITMPRPRVIDN